MKHIKLIWIIIFVIGLGARSTRLFKAADTESWRESDISTIAKNFYQNGTDIFHPQIAWDGSGPGYTESEFQIYSYLIAISYKIFGFWEPTGRIISFLFSLATMLVFFKLCRYLLHEKAALAASFFFTISPILLVISNSIQPESVMFYFYICSAYTFIRWLDSQSKKYYLLTIISTALALLCKITAVNIGLLFLLLIIFKKDWKFLFKPKVLIFGVLSILPSIMWYLFSNRFYVLYGNSLGISNEYAWVGWDFFTSWHFISGIFNIELYNVWMLSGPLIIILAFLFTKIARKESTLLLICWYASVFVFYVIAARTTSENWAYYYHIFSIPAFTILLGSAVFELYDKYSVVLILKTKLTMSRIVVFKNRIILGTLILFVSFFILTSFRYMKRYRATYFQTSEFYVCKDSLISLIPAKSLLLAHGGACSDKSGHPHAYNASYFFYWLDRKGYNICIEELTFKNILFYKTKGVTYFLAEERELKLKPGLEDELRRNLVPIFECNGCILFKL